MFDEESYAEYAKGRIIVGWVFGTILGIVAIVAGIICTIVSIKNNSGKELIGASVLLLGFGILFTTACVLLLVYRKRNHK